MAAIRSGHYDYGRSITNTGGVVDPWIKVLRLGIFRHSEGLKSFVSRS